MPRIPLFPAADLPPGARRLVRVGRIEVGVFNVDGTILAYRNICPHAGAPVCEGSVSGTTLPSAVYEYKLGHTGCILRCPWHGWEFDLRTGEHLVDPETRLKNLPVGAGAAPGAETLESFSVRHENDFLFVEVPG
jgi:nitrite reductase/ring-hydroxylating ferredoxin subunit